MSDHAQLTSDRVPEIDAAALLAIYNRYDNNTLPEDVSVTSLGPWETTSMNLTADLGRGAGALSFGVRRRNGVSVPWASGARSPIALASNRSLTGTVHWDGALLGLTPETRSVVGNATLSIDVSTLEGRADFTALQSWPAGQAPGEFGTGEKWRTGSLGYTIAVSDSYVRSTGGDAGVLGGSFYGSGHEGIGGSVEREDLTAAFGAKRR